MDVNLLCWCDDLGAVKDSQALQQQLAIAASIIRQLVGKLVDLERHGETRATAPDWVRVQIDDWRRAMTPLTLDLLPTDTLRRLANVVDQRAIAEEAFRAALIWHCHNPQATLEAATLAARRYADQFNNEVKAA